MESIKIDLSENFSSIELHTFADLHLGDAECDLTRIKEKIEYVKNKDNAFAILNGDLMNNATKESVSDVYAEQLTPMQELERCIELFEPIKDKILCVTTGNHERRSYKGAGIDLMQIFARELGIEDKFASIAAVLFIRFGWNAKRKRKQWYSVYVTHGSGGGRREGGKVNRLADMANIVDCDIYIHSHTHLPMIMKEGYYRTDFINSKVTFVDKLFVNTSSMLGYGGYGQIFEYKPGSKDTPTIYLNGISKNFTATL